MYVTPTRFRNMGFGVDLTGYTDQTLASILEHASAIADDYCAVPLSPVKYDFRGSSIGIANPGKDQYGNPLDFGEPHDWQLGTDLESGTRRVYLWAKPIKSVQLMRIYVTNSQYVEISPSEMFIQAAQGWIEVVALAVTSIGVFGSGLVPNLGLARPLSRTSYTYGYSNAVANETAYPDGAPATPFIVYRTVNEWWDPAVAPVVTKNGAVVVASAYDVDYDGGAVTLHSAASSSDVIKITYAYRCPYGITWGVGQIATYLIGESNLAAKGLLGLEQARVAELMVSRPRMRSSGGGAGSLNADNLSRLVPAAAINLEGYRFTSAN